MDLSEALRTTGAVREFTDDPVDDDTVHHILELARFSPNGGNRQVWRVIVVRDATLRRGLRDPLYLPGWYEYLALNSGGVVPWAPLGDRAAEDRALSSVGQVAAAAQAGPGGFAEHLDRVPVLLAVLADLRALAAIDRDLGRYGLVGAASIYPFCWSILLAARVYGVGGVLTTVLARREAQVRELLGIPDHHAVAAGSALGHPVRWPRRLRRREVADFATLDRFDGEPLAASA